VYDRIRWWIMKIRTHVSWTRGSLHMLSMVIFNGDLGLYVEHMFIARILSMVLSVWITREERSQRCSSGGLRRRASRADLKTQFPHDVSQRCISPLKRLSTESLINQLLIRRLAYQ
jgi:hypothetical protein